MQLLLDRLKPRLAGSAAVRYTTSPSSTSQRDVLSSEVTEAVLTVPVFAATIRLQQGLDRSVFVSVA